MKIWEAVLILTYDDDDNYCTRFKIIDHDEEYELNSAGTAWTCWKDWIGNTLPVNMTATKSSWGDLEIIQGFDRELTEEEKEELKNKMHKKMASYLLMEMKRELKRYQSKLDIVIDNIVEE